MTQNCVHMFSYSSCQILL